MSRQIVLDLRHCERIGIEPGKLLEDAADRIEALEAALREIAKHDFQALAIDALNPGTRAALGEKK